MDTKAAGQKVSIGFWKNPMLQQQGWSIRTFLHENPLPASLIHSDGIGMGL
jgi:hypothetical protein